MSELRRVRREASNAALEDAAKVAEAELVEAWKGCQPISKSIAAAIRALKSPPPGGVGEGDK